MHLQGEHIIILKLTKEYFYFFLFWVSKLPVFENFTEEDPKGFHGNEFSNTHESQKFFNPLANLRMES